MAEEIKKLNGHQEDFMLLDDANNKFENTAIDPPETKEKTAQPRLYRRRWLMAFLFAAYSASNAYQWIHLNIIGDKILEYYEQSLPQSQHAKDVILDWLSMVYMLAYIPLIIPSTWLLEHKGLQVVGIIGTFLNCLGAWIKCTSINPHRFSLLMAGQTICAIAQVFILGIPARLAAVWFGPNEVSTATAIGVFGNQIGVAMGFLIPPIILSYNSDENYQIEDNNNLNTTEGQYSQNVEFIGERIKIMLYSGACVTTILFILVIIFFKKNPPIPPSIAQMVVVDSSLGNEKKYFHTLHRLFTHFAFVLLFITYGLNTGSYYALGTLLNPIILYYFPNEHLNAGRIGLTLVLSGVAGSIIAGLWLDKTKLYKLTTVTIYVLSCIGMLAFTFTLIYSNIYIVFLCSGILGFFMTGYLPVGFEFAAELTYPEPEGTSSGLLNASAQIFGIILTLGIRAMTLKVGHGMFAGNLTISALLLVGAIVTILIKAELRRQRAVERVNIDTINLE